MILPRLLGWNIHQNDTFFVTFLVATHLATALVLLAFFWRDWVRILRGLGRSLRDREIGDDTDARLGWLLVVGTIPAGLLGLLLEHALRSLFASAPLGGALPDPQRRHAVRRRAPAPRAPVAERATPSDDDARIAGRSAGARRSASAPRRRSRSIPGFSRSGATMGGGLLVGLSNEDAARFAFLLATPIIGAAARAEAARPARPERRRRARPGARRRALLGATAYLAVRFLMRYFETNRLTPFAVYCVAAGVAASLYFAF